MSEQTDKGCDSCGNTESLLWFRFLYNPVPVFSTAGVDYRGGQKFKLCDRCMAELMDVVLDIRNKTLRVNDSEVKG